MTLSFSTSSASSRRRQVCPPSTLSIPRHTMDNTFSWDSSHYPPPASGSEAESTGGIATPDPDPFNCWPVEEPFFDWDGLDNPELYTGGTYDPHESQWPPAWMAYDLTTPAELQPVPDGLPVQQQPSDTLVDNGPLPAEPFPLRPLTDVSQWLDGAYRPPMPCSYCRRHRLQCLIIRTTSANPNPVSSCSSCVALFRECSLALGEKRQPSGFETLSPVLGNLHGLRELSEDAAAIAPGTHLTAAPVLEEPSDPTCSNPEPKDSKMFVRKGARLLRAWFLQNQAHPYPTETQKAQLVRETGFSRQRIATWFANARRRQKHKVIPSVSSRIHRAGSPMPVSTATDTTPHWTSMTPLERWQASPPEEDAVPESAIRDAIATVSSTDSDWGVASSQDSLQLDSFLNFDDTSSHLDSGFESRRSDASSDSVSSAWSHQSDGGVLLPAHMRRPPSASAPRPTHPPSDRSSTTSRHSHRGRQRRPNLSKSTTTTNQYQCTFCPQSFKKKNDWHRHESTVHLSLSSWICTPDLSSLLPQPTPNTEECLFCTTIPSSPSHWEDHDFRACASKPLAERSFSRKDHLWQHLRKFHGCSKTPVPNLDAWRSSGGGSLRSRCGFCGVGLGTWAERAEHLAGHFRDGARMSEWVGGWGFEEDVRRGLKGVVGGGWVGMVYDEMGGL